MNIVKLNNGKVEDSHRLPKFKDYLLEIEKYCGQNK